MRRGELELLAARHVPGQGAVRIERINSGLVNETYRMVRDGAVYALRAATSARGAPGLDAAWEARVIESAAAVNLAPEPVFSDPERRILISRWIEGRSWNSSDVRSRENLSRITGLMRRVHALAVPSPPRRMDPAQWMERYSAAAADSCAAGRENPLAGALRAPATRRLTELDGLPGMDPVLCHSDLHVLNLIDRGDSLVLLDWEYAHFADPFWDLAGWCANNDFEDELRYELLAAYVGRPPSPHERLRLELECWLYDYVCWLWCELHAARRAQAPGVAGRARQLAARLVAAASGRTPQVPAH